MATSASATSDWLQQVGRESALLPALDQPIACALVTGSRVALREKGHTLDGAPA